MAKIILNSTPKQIADGTKKAYVTSRAGYFKVVVSDTLPDKSSWHFEQKIYAENAKLWAWSDHGEVPVDVSAW